MPKIRSTVNKLIKPIVSVVGRPWTVDYKKGFTLVELMVVISILTIVSSIGLVFYGQAEITGRDSKRQEDIKEIQKALEQYYSLNTNYPSSIYSASLNSSFQAGAAPHNPRDGAPYTYFNCTSRPRYIVCAHLEICDNKCNRTSTVGLDPCVNSAGDNTTPTGSVGFYCAGSLSN